MKANLATATKMKREAMATPPKITKIEAFKVELPLHEGSYKWSGGNSVEVFDSTVVAVHTDVDVTGYGEICPLGPAYLPAYAEGARTGIKELAKHLIGLDPTALLVVNDRMDAALRGHPYVKSALDVACWDILGRVTGQPVVTLLGGRYGDSFALYRAISQETPEEMARKVALSEGYTKFQLKVGGNADTDIKRILKISKVGGLTKATTDSRSLYLARHCPDDRGHVGSRYCYGCHCSSGAQHTPCVPVLVNRLQQLCHREHRRGSSSAKGRASCEESWFRDQPALGCAGTASFLHFIKDLRCCG